MTEPREGPTGRWPCDDGWTEIAPHVFQHDETEHRVLSAEKTWELLRENRVRTTQFQAEIAKCSP
jgi:hypothetical protein